jgi:hypothetical protein
MKNTNTYVNAADFAEYLRMNNLIIVSKQDLELSADILRNKLLKKKWLSLSEIITAKFFKYKDSETLRRMCLDGRIPKDAFTTLENGQYRICTQHIKTMING